VNLNVTKVVEASKEWSKAEKALAIALWSEVTKPKARRKYARKAKVSQPAAEVAPAKAKRASKAGNGGAELGPKFPKPGPGRPRGSKNKKTRATMLPVEPAAPVAQA
jgi:hypothetical protein